MKHNNLMSVGNSTYLMQYNVISACLTCIIFYIILPIIHEILYD